MKKKFFSLVLAFAFILTTGICLTACGGNNNPTAPTDRYQVSFETWTAQLKLENLKNLTATNEMTTKLADENATVVSVEKQIATFDNGKIHQISTTNGSTDGEECYVWAGTAFDYYYKAEENWKKHPTDNNADSTFEGVIADKIKVVTSLWEFYPSFEYKEATHTYESTLLPVAFDGEGEDRTIVIDHGDHFDNQVYPSKFVLKFENNKLISLELKFEINNADTQTVTTVIATITNIGKSTVPLPTVAA